MTYGEVLKSRNPIAEPKEVENVKPLDRDLLRRLREAEVEAKQHPSAPTLDAMSLYQKRLTAQELERVEAHLTVCARCRELVEDTRSKADFFSRQKTTFGECE